MKKSRIFAICAALLLAVSTAGCGTTDANSTSTDTTPTESSLTEETSETNHSENSNNSENSGNSAGAVSFKTGLWEGESGFYYFSDSSSGSTSSYDDHTGTSFQYEMYDDGTAVFHMGASDDNTPVTVTMTDTSAIILWTSDKQERLDYLEGYTRSDFDNFSDNSELIEMAKSYYNDSIGTKPDSAEISGKYGLYALIAVYANDEVVAEYTINRCTLSGTCETTGESVSFSN